jgi:hypothetical protein
LDDALTAATTAASDAALDTNITTAQGEITTWITAEETRKSDARTA